LSLCKHIQINSTARIQYLKKRRRKGIYGEKNQVVGVFWFRFESKDRSKRKKERETGKNKTNKQKFFVFRKRKWLSAFFSFGFHIYKQKKKREREKCFFVCYVLYNAIKKQRKRKKTIMNRCNAQKTRRTKNKNSLRC